MILLNVLMLGAQPIYTLLPESLPNSNKPAYWKNHLPYPGYWQQEVDYTIKAILIDSTNEIQGDMILKYANNSPDTLKKVYFHLYQNAFQPGSYYDQLKKAYREKTAYGPNESAGKGTLIYEIQADNQTLSFKIDNTIAEVPLNTPLAPGQTIELNLKFSSWFDGGGKERRRMKVFPVEAIHQEKIISLKHFDGVHWYPRIAVYDRRNGWDTYQHLSKEFYGDFGTYRVSLTLPPEYILEATGKLLNESIVLPDARKAELEITQFKDKPIGELANYLSPANPESLTWEFLAENVHDFAFTADPTYRRGETVVNGIRCISLAQEQNAGGWQDASKIAAKCIDLYSQHIGQYQYPKMVVADAQDGMEYPMLTLDGGHSPGYTGLLAHEIGHNWFFGMIGTHETYRAWMDEGFTQYLTMWAMDTLRHWKGIGISNDRKQQGYMKFMIEANKGYAGSLNTLADAYYAETGHPGMYSMAYHKTAVMLYNLEMILGKETFAKALQFYFNRWLFCHPYPEDFRLAITDYTHQDLTAFFDQWLEKDLYLDYGIQSVKHHKGKLTIQFIRKGTQIQGFDFRITQTGGGYQDYHLPDTKTCKTETGVTCLSPWYQLGALGKTHSITLEMPNKPIKIEIDPSRRFGDINLLNNRRGGALPIKAKGHWIQPLKQGMDWENYLLTIRPNIWWNAYSGLQTGLQVKGNYLNHHRITLAGWYAQGTPKVPDRTGALQIYKNDWHRFSYFTEWETPIPALGRGVEISIQSGFRDGAWRNAAGISKTWAAGNSQNLNQSSLYGGWVYLWRPQSAWQSYLLTPNSWGINQPNAYLKLGLKKQYRVFGGYGRWNLQLRNAAPGSDSDYRNIRFESIYEIDGLQEKIKLRYRGYFQLGEGNTPLESQTYLAGGNPEEMYGNDFYRARGFFADPWLNNYQGTSPNNVHFGGGYNLRGYTGYQAEFGDGSAAWYGNSGVSFNLELEFGKLIPLHLNILKDHVQLHTYLFGDGGVIGKSIQRTGFDKTVWDVFRSDWGAGAALDLYRSKRKQSKPLILRADFPLLLTQAPYTQDNFEFRWLIAVGRAF